MLHTCGTGAFKMGHTGLVLRDIGSSASVKYTAPPPPPPLQHGLAKSEVELFDFKRDDF